MLKGNLLGTNHCERVKLSLIDNYIFQRIGLEKFFFFLSGSSLGGHTFRKGLINAYWGKDKVSQFLRN